MRVPFQTWTSNKESITAFGHTNAFFPIERWTQTAQQQGSLF